MSELHAAPRRALYGEARDLVFAVIEGRAPVEPNGCILWPFAENGHGYAMVGGQAWGSRRPLLVGRVVLEAVHGPPPSPEHSMGHAPRAVCGSRRCVSPAHLSWQTAKEQAAHQRLDGTLHPPCIYLGASHHLTRFSDDEVAIAVARVKAGETKVGVAADIGVSISTLRNWCNGTFRRKAIAHV